MIMSDRAQTDEQKRECIESILEYWKKFPDYRLGQLIENACFYWRKTNSKPISSDNDIFYIEDYQIVNFIKEYHEEFNKQLEELNK